MRKWECGSGKKAEARGQKTDDDNLVSGVSAAAGLNSSQFNRKRN
jgi:hypothetical protein